MTSMKRIKEIIERYKNLYINYCKENKERKLAKRAEELYDTTIYNHNVWLTYEGNLVIPFSMLGEKNMDIEACAEIVDLVRDMYIKRNL